MKQPEALTFSSSSSCFPKKNRGLLWTKVLPQKSHQFSWEQWNGVISKPVFKNYFCLQVKTHLLLSTSGPHAMMHFPCQGDYSLDKIDKEELILSVLKAEKHTQGDTEHPSNTSSWISNISSTSCFETGGRSWLQILIIFFMLDFLKIPPLLSPNFPFQAANFDIPLRVRLLQNLSTSLT